MENQLRLALLGKLQIEQGGQPLSGLTSMKGQALLAYLAVTGQPHSRPALAGLLWGDMPEEAARTNLRGALSQLRRLVGEALLVTRQTVELDWHGRVWSDVTIFEQAANRGQQLQAAADLYRGELLTDFHIGEALDFEEWLRIERERYHRLALTVLERLAGEALQQSRYGEGITAARRLLRLEPWHEDGHQVLMRLLASSGQRTAALVQYEVCRAAFEEAFGIAPSAATTALYEAIRTGSWDRPQAAQTEPINLSLPRPDRQPRHNLPAAATAFVGRRVEQVQINNLLAKEDCRLITIVGPGGMGKTRLALVVATAQIEPETIFSDGVYFVSLAAANPATSETNPLILAIAAAVGLSFAGNVAPTVQLLNALRHKKMLLVLDNFEHLTGYTSLLVELLAQSPGLKIIVTSRQSLNTFEEWVLDLWGLPYPAEDDNTDLETFDSIRLFAQQAQRVSQSFELAAELPDVARICRLLAGMPLALEMAASWVRTISCRSIVREIERNFDFLTAAEGVPDRQRSLRTIFDYSWQMLMPAEQAVLARLSVFRAHFTAEAAIEVAGASYPILANLVAKSLLLPCARSERYCAHELLRQYGAEKLAEAALFRARHARYFAALLGRQEEALLNGQGEVIALITAEINNIRVAWQWAIEQADEVVLDQLLGTIVTLCELRGWLQEGRDRCRQAIAVVAQSSSPQSRLLLGRLEENLARFYDHLGEYAEAQKHVEKSLRLFERLDAPHHVARVRALLGYILSAFGDNVTAERHLKESLKTFEALDHIRGQADSCFYLSYIATGLGDRVEGLRYAEESLNHYRRLADRRNTARGLYLLGNFQIGFGNYAQALDYYAASKTLHQALGNSIGLADCLRNEGLTALYLGRLDEAERAAEASRQLFAQFGDQPSMARNINNLGQVAAERAEYGRARQYLEESLALFEAMGLVLPTVLVHGQLGSSLVELGDLESAKAHFRQALESGMSSQAPLNLLTVLAHMTNFLIDQELIPLAITTLAHTAHNPITEAVFRRKAEAGLQKLTALVTPDVFGCLTTQGQQSSLEEIVTRLLAAMWEEVKAMRWDEPV